MTFNYRALTHTELINYFAFPWQIYIICYTVVFLVCIAITAIFTIYHQILSR